MPSEKLARILRKKSPFSAAEIARISDVDGWNWVYANVSPLKEKLPGICFTGFTDSEKVELATLAKEAHLSVASAVTKSLQFLCVGENAGPAKLQKARAQGVTVMTRAEFENFLETGEIPIVRGISEG